MLALRVTGSVVVVAIGSSAFEPTKALALTAAFALCFPFLGAPEAYAVDAAICGALMGTYSIAPYANWGKAPLAIQKTWNESDCNHRICEYMQKDVQRRSPSVVGFVAGPSSGGLGHAAGQLQCPIAESDVAQEID